jgi:hypothetical protein
MSAKHIWNRPGKAFGKPHLRDSIDPDAPRYTEPTFAAGDTLMPAGAPPYPRK